MYLLTPASFVLAGSELRTHREPIAFAGAPLPLRFTPNMADAGTICQRRIDA
jgi:hypothetical protein